VDTVNEAAATMTTILETSGVEKRYQTRQGEGITALRDVSFSVDDGEFVSLVGPSGCGKTTLLKICAGLVPATGGTVDFRQTGAPVPPGVFGMVFQSPALLPWRTILANVLYPADILGLDRRAAKTRAQELLGLMGLGDVADKYPGELSGGMQQRVSIARALLHDPEMLFMDEPFGALDAMTREEMNMELQQVHLSQGKTVLFVTHSISEAVLLSDRVVVLSRRPGQVVADLRVPFGRPRTMEHRADPEFGKLELQIRQSLETVQE
jgi:NitT/TauT family transport system ATP-binding protein